MNTATTQKNDAHSIVGVWQIKDFARQKGDRLVGDRTIPSLFIFAHHHYCMVWVLSAEPQREFAQRWHPTDSEKVERFDSLVVNAGTYEITESTMTAYPIVARIPEFAGGKLVCEYQVEGDSVRLKFVDEYTYDGIQAPWVASGRGLTLTLVRIAQ